ncbi:hypothetical protein SAMN05421874_1741 [Nonomuraea maritima]|uniref:Uncharacterized protein n=1 Tax=Nonomuraea maritima TaxID=683260 RepID=A0A1G9SX38_9ACTN|nr:hypothetical protein [Nonomuraea maritima]SDM39990.1 hypothetical protein SAMN05421874_1741 [Nonomuraea maritima]
MALQGPIPVTFAMVFPHGCYIVGEVEPVKDFDASTGGRFRPNWWPSSGRTSTGTARPRTDGSSGPGRTA